jgi:hypothetical protein
VDRAGSAAGTARTLLRTSLRKYVRSQGLSPEAVITLEYAPSLSPPQAGPHQPVEDWVNALDVAGGVVVAGLVNGSVTLLPLSALAPLAQPAGAAASSSVSAGVGAAYAAHAGAITGVHLLEAADIAVAAAGAGSGLLCATSGKDSMVRLWRVASVAAPAVAAGGSRARAAAGAVASAGTRYILTQFAECEGATDSCGAVRLDPSGRLASAGDARGGVYLWSAGLPAGPGAGSTAGDDGRPARKRARVGSASSETDATGSGAVTVEHRAPATRHAGAHSQAVTSTAWVSSGTVASASWDASVRLWDVEAGMATVAELRTGKAVTAISPSPLGSTLATAHPDHVVRLWDTRGRDGAAGELAAAVDSGVTSAVGLRSALRGVDAATTTWMAAVAWSPRSSHHVAAAGNDGGVFVWDIRAAAAPLFTVHSHGPGQQALAVAWGFQASAGGEGSGDRDDVAEAAGAGDLGLVVSGGADAALRASALNRRMTA